MGLLWSCSWSRGHGTPEGFDLPSCIAGNQPSVEHDPIPIPASLGLEHEEFMSCVASSLEHYTERPGHRRLLSRDPTEEKSSPTDTSGRRGGRRCR